MKNNELASQVAEVVRACQSKKAEDIRVLQLDAQASGFTDYFVLCSGANPRQVQAISDEVDHRLGGLGVNPKHIEGYTQAEWVLMDYVDFVVHIFSQNARKFYDLERLWKTASPRELADLEKPTRKPAAAKTASAAKAPRKATKSAPRKRTSTKSNPKSS